MASSLRRLDLDGMYQALSSLKYALSVEGKRSRRACESKYRGKKCG